MRNYDYKKAKRIILENADKLESASLGMHEDWFWTAETIWDDGEFKVNLDEEGLKLVGINGSPWGTPVLELIPKEGHTKNIHCFEGKRDFPMPEHMNMALGEMSGPIQDDREGIQLEDV